MLVRKLRKRRVGAGYFQCPKCSARTPATLFHAIVREFLFGIIPLWSQEVLGRVYECHKCHSFYEDTEYGKVADGALAFDYSQSPTPSVWRCRNCGSENPNTRWTCQRCGKHV
jgi:hypothetical protein